MLTDYQPTDQEEVAVKAGEEHPMRKRVLLTGVGLVVLGLISGLYAYESVKGRNVNMKRGTESAAADHMNVIPPIDEARPGPIETATFAMG